MRYGIPGVVALFLVGACSSSGSGASSGGASSGTSGGTSGRASSGSSGSGASGGSPGGSSGAVAGTAPVVAGCKIFPDDNPWNLDVSQAPVDAELTKAIGANLQGSTALHPDFGSFDDEYGIPITTGAAGVAVPVTWSTSYGRTESDPLPCTGVTGSFCYPIPLDAKIEGGIKASSKSDRHVLFLDTTGAPDKCTLYELYNAQNPTGAWTASNGAIFHLDSNTLRKDGWTSADAAGLAILPGLIRADEALAGEIKHAIRFTMNDSYNGYIHPATHAAGSDDASLAPMGLRLRLKASFDTTTMTGPSLAIANAMKKYGVLLADNGSDWYIGGETSDKWTPDVMDEIVSSMSKIRGGDFEIVKTGTVSTAGL